MLRKKFIRLSSSGLSWFRRNISSCIKCVRMIVVCMLVYFLDI